MLAQQATGSPPDPATLSPHDQVWRKYLAELSTHTGRPVIVYASGWLEGRPVPDPSFVGVATRDMMGSMEAVHGLSKGLLDLILHSPGGDADAAKAIMSYLRDVGFDPIRSVIPIAAMSASTMMALSCDEILMGHHSQLGPIDPQFTLMKPDGPRTAPAQAILDQFKLANQEYASSPQVLAAWLPILHS
jgi:ClpP class serine protease